MSLSPGELLIGMAELAAVGLGLLWAAVGVRAWMLPGWSGAPARLAEAVVWLALLIWVAEALGALGLLEDWPLLLAGVGTGAGVGAAARRAARQRRGPFAVPPSPSAGRIAVAAAAIGVAAVAAAWTIPAVQNLRFGIDGIDNIWYHLPQAARFVQTGSVLDLHFTDPYLLNWFYPANAELLHAVGMLALGRDLLSPLVNHAFLALGLLAAWCIGRPWGMGPQAMVGAALVFGMEMTLDFQAGDARSDATGLALFLASVGLLVNVRVARPDGDLSAVPVWSSGGGLAGLALAGLAAGLAAGTKLSLIAPVAALSVGVVAIAASGVRLRAAGVWTAALLAGGGFWYARNLAHAGNPLPWIGELGPLSLPAPEQSIELRPPFSVSHYFGDLDTWSDWLLPGLANGIGPLWPAILALVALSAGLALLIGGRAMRREGAVSTRPFEGRAARAYGGSVPERPGTGPAWLAMLGAVVVVTTVAYLFTPLTASGEEGAPVGFVWNLRYLGPALALGLALLALLPPLQVGPWRWATLGVLIALLLAQVALLDVWKRDARRYDSLLATFHLDEAAAWADGVSDARIATAGRGGVFFQYVFYGEDLSNHVQWVGVPGPHGAWLPASDCAEWRAAVNAGNYDYAVTTFDAPNPGNDRTSEVRQWIENDPAAHPILQDDPVAVYELTGPLDTTPNTLRECLGSTAARR